jgi:hypothetical protein
LLRLFSFVTAPFTDEVWAGWFVDPAELALLDGQPASVTAIIMARMDQRRPRASRDNVGLLIFQAPDQAVCEPAATIATMVNRIEPPPVIIFSLDPLV